MGSILLLGVLMGMQHALEADHVAAVSSIVCRARSAGRIVRHGVIWGLGHSVTLLAVAVLGLATGLTLGERLAAWLEGAVGIMLVVLGLHVLYRLLRDRVHFHMHRHDGGTVHLHAHSHAGESGGGHGFHHQHEHREGLPFRTLLVGMMHGLAGSAALMVLTAATIRDPFTGLLYVLLFGLGSVAGMALLSALIAVPLAWSARMLTAANRLLQGAVGLATAGLGAVVLYRAAMAIAA
ncbi:MAG: high frequency lysogenization protein HflD [Rhodospirillales bacterium]|nr:MAG: high frequency lysogenization protein HflD [Rhodospirillales bacterium]